MKPDRPVTLPPPGANFLFRRSASPGDADTRWLACCCFVLGTGLLLNLPVFWRRGVGLAERAGLSQALWVTLLEAALVLGLSGLLIGLAALAGRSALRMVGASVILVGAAAAWFMWQFQVVIGYGTVLATLTRDHDLTRELLDARLMLWWTALGLLPTLAWLRHTPGSWWRGHRRVARLAGWLVWIAVCAVLMSGARLALASATRVTQDVVPADAPRASSAAGVAAHAYLPSNWLAGVGAVAGQAWRQHRDGQQLKDPSVLHRHLPTVPLDGLVVVLVIGETTRHDRMGVLGHHRDTTPHLARERDLAAFAARSCDTSTQLSLACMFVRPQAVVAGLGGAPDRVTERDVFAVYRSLGFRIELYALQGEAGFYSRVGADEMKLREMILAEPQNLGRPTHDVLLVDQLRAAVDRHEAREPRQPLLVVLHTKGSHYHYAQRYPVEQAIWRPDCSDPDGTCDEASLFNAFDNSVRYVDTVLQGVRDVVRQRRALVVYAADHGESIGGGTHFHATPKAIAPPEQFKVPMLFWASRRFLADPALAAGHARLMDRARVSPADRHGHHELYASLLGCMGVRSPDGGIDPALDLCAGP
ncbi:kdo(2)-lipid A phosphoethanolamine 7''-transferase [Sphaerotilus mobilis]|uniref:KDO II ethanolaminephosphotransferase n=1 Tax=Sphaerotilus mobilis TaxID=47994 RepID=A0A4Q7L989_9BURK|nr:kdo(2)-lipid A phosphoethanolamine 7''-transferase [Sphaerotilus mobilis]RZS46655.1 KDO II ethanolaminephosphotransferase [Sphaerotilus mobilis]